MKKYSFNTVQFGKIQVWAETIEAAIAELRRRITEELVFAGAGTTNQSVK